MLFLYQATPATAAVFQCLITLGRAQGFIIASHLAVAVLWSLRDNALTTPQVVARAFAIAVIMSSIFVSYRASSLTAVLCLVWIPSGVAASLTQIQSLSGVCLYFL